MSVASALGQKERSVFADVAAVRGAAARLRLRSIVGAVVASLSSKIVDAAAARGAAARLQLRPVCLVEFVFVCLFSFVFRAFSSAVRCVVV